MNYIVGYLYLTFEDEEITYIVFDYIMRNYFARYFENEFEMLVKINSIFLEKSILLIWKIIIPISSKLISSF